MNSHSIYSNLQNQNDRLLNLKSRMRKTVSRICGSAPPRGPEVAGLSPAKAEATYLNDLDSVITANDEILSDIVNELLWLESTFGTGDTEGPAYPSEKAYR